MLGRRRSVVMTQRLLPTLERSQRLARRFKRGIVTVTALLFVCALGGTAAGRYGITALALRSKWAVQRVIGLPRSRADIELELRRKRTLDIERTDKLYRRFYYDEVGEAWQRVFKVAGLAPGDALIRPANYERTTVLSSRVFERDDTGRSYRLRPNTRSLWTRNHTFPHGISCFFFLPDEPEVLAAIKGAHDSIIEESRQVTNSWGYRGPEPDLNAPVRVLVLGDSFMQGIFVPEDDTPPERLHHALEKLWGLKVSVLNTGHIGYSPEQYYFTMLQELDRFKPHVIVLSLYTNDFGNADLVIFGKGDPSEGLYYVDAILQECRTRQVPCFICPVIDEQQATLHRTERNFPGVVTRLQGVNTFNFVNQTDVFVEEHIRLMNAARRRGRVPYSSPLWNGHLGDRHFSPLGSDLWARTVARRIAIQFDPPGAHPTESGE